MNFSRITYFSRRELRRILYFNPFYNRAESFSHMVVDDSGYIKISRVIYELYLFICLLIYDNPVIKKICGSSEVLLPYV